MFPALHKLIKMLLCTTAADASIRLHAATDAVQPNEGPFVRLVQKPHLYLALYCCVYRTKYKTKHVFCYSASRHNKSLNICSKTASKNRRYLMRIVHYSVLRPAQHTRDACLLHVQQQAFVRGRSDSCHFCLHWLNAEMKLRETVTYSAGALPVRRFLCLVIL